MDAVPGTVRQGRRWIVASLIVLLFASSALAQQGPEERTRHVLLLNSYHQTMTWVQDILRAVEDELRPESRDILLHVENMDTKRFHSEAYLLSLAQSYRIKYRDTPIDLILASDNQAFDFLRRHRDDLFPGAPVVFCGLNDFRDEMLQGLAGYTGVAEVFSARTTLELALKLHPDTREVLVINDYLKTGRAWERSIRAQLRGLERKVDLRYAPDMTLDELRRKLASLEPGTLVLLGVYFSDREGRYLTYERIGALLAEASAVPVYCLLEFNVGPGVVGGRVISGYYQGKVMAELGRRVLAGEDPEKIPVVERGANRYVFNYPQLQRFGIDPERLPERSLILNRPFSFYHEYRWGIWLTGTFMALLVGAVAVLAFNVHRRRRAERSLTLALTSAEEARLKLDAILKSVAEGLVVVGTDRRIVLMNPAAEAYLGLPLSEALGRSVEETGVESGLAEQLESVLGGAEDEQLDEWEQVGSGERRVIQAHTAAVSGVAGRRAGAITLLRDVSREREVDRVKNEFISTAAHELRTPLTAVLGYAELLLQQEEYGTFTLEQQREFFQTIYDKSMALNHIVEDLLDLSRVQSGRLVTLDRQEGDIAALLQRVVNSHRPMTDRHRFEIRLPENCPPLFFDEAKLEQLLENLISNAVKFSPRGGEIRVSGEVCGEEFRVQVRDEGIGMTPTQVERVFDKFYRVDASDTGAPGLGLGMAIARNIAEAHGGRIWVESEPGRGTCASFTLPLAPKDE